MNKTPLTALTGLDAVMGSALDAVVAVDSAGIVVGCNEVAEELFGWTVAQAKGQLLSELIIPPKYRNAHQGGMAHYRRTGEARVVNRRIEITAVNRAGVEFPVELSIVEVSGEGGLAFIGFIRDITQRRITQERLTLSEESLRLTTEAAEIGTWDLDLRTDVLVWSDRTKAMFGISRDVPCSMADFYAGLHPDDLGAVTAAFARALDPDERATYDVEYRTVGKEDGLIRWVAAKGRGIFDGAGQCVRAVGTAIDITARKRADARHAFMLQLSDVLRAADTEAALKRACALMGGYFGVSRVGYGQLDPVEDVFDYSTCWTDGSVPPLLGRFPARAFGPKIVARLGAGETVVVVNLLADPLSDEPETRATAQSVDTRAILVVPFLRGDRLRTIVYLNDRHIHVWTAEEIAFMQEVAERTREVIDRAEAEAQLRALNATLEARVEERTQELRLLEDALRQAQKMEALGQLTGGIAHDFNNFLQGITGSLEMLTRLVQKGKTDNLEKYLATAMSSSRSAAGLTQRLLAFARQQPLTPEAIDMNALLLAMQELLRRSAGAQAVLEMALQDNLWAARCDASQLESAVLNLVINARDAMPSGGTITVETGNRTIAGQAGQLAQLEPGDYVCVRVTDTGTGMDAETASKAFEPFFTTKPSGRGTGLGLSMIYGFVRQSGGHASIESIPGQGTSVSLLLPRGRCEEALTASSPQDQPSRLVGSGETIFVVEDDPLIRSLVANHLRDAGFDVREAEDGRSGLEALISASDIALLITDLGLPHLNGLQLANSARSVDPEIKVLFMTGYTESDLLPDGPLPSGTKLIAKPFALADLETKIVALLGGR